MLTIAVDAMGGDNAPKSEVEGAIRAAFVELLQSYCTRKKLMLIENIDYITTDGSRVTPDGTIRDATAPTTTFTTPAATVYQSTTDYAVAWTETETGSGVASRSLQRQVATYTASSQTCGTFANDGSADTTASPVSVSGLVAGSCYRWIQTLTDTVGNSGPTTSGNLVVDATAPTVTSTPASGASYRSSTAMIASATMRSRSFEYLAIGNLCPSGSGSTKWSE